MKSQWHLKIGAFKKSFFDSERKKLKLIKKRFRIQIISVLRECRNKAK